MVQHFVNDLRVVQIVRIAGRPVISLFQQRLLGFVAHKNREITNTCNLASVIKHSNIYMLMINK